MEQTLCISVEKRMHLALSVLNTHNNGNNAVTNFTFSAWLIPNVSTDGYIVEKDNDNGTLYYGVKIQTNDSHVSVVLHYTALGSNMTYMAKTSVMKYLDENTWLHVLITLDESIIEFYVDGILVLGGMKSLKGEAILDGEPLLFFSIYKALKCIV